jgi:hypothetical protein
MSTQNTKGRVACVEWECPPYAECGGGICDPSYEFRDLFYEANPEFFPPLRFEYDRYSNTFFVSIDVKPRQLRRPHVVVGVGRWERFVDRDGDTGRRYVFLPDEELFPILRKLANELLDDTTILWNVRWCPYPTFT